MNTIDHTSEISFNESKNSSEFAKIIDTVDNNSTVSRHFDATLPRPTSARWSRLYATNFGQNMDITGDAQALLRHETVDDSMAQSMSSESGISTYRRNGESDRGETESTSERSSIASANAYLQQDNPARSEQSRKGKRAAEARRRLELLEEERELQDNLAEFWDSRFDKPQRRFPLTSSNVLTKASPPQQTQENAADSHESMAGTKHC